MPYTCVHLKLCSLWLDQQFLSTGMGLAGWEEPEGTFTVVIVVCMQILRDSRLSHLQSIKTILYTVISC